MKYFTQRDRELLYQETKCKGGLKKVSNECLWNSYELCFAFGLRVVECSFMYILSNMEIFCTIAEHVIAFAEYKFNSIEILSSDKLQSI